jgi:hypothetical protein
VALLIDTSGIVVRDLTVRNGTLDGVRISIAGTVDRRHRVNLRGDVGSELAELAPNSANSEPTSPLRHIPGSSR